MSCCLGFLKNNEPKKAVDLFDKMKTRNDVIYILFFNACAQLKSNEALNLIRKTVKNIPEPFYSNLKLVASLIDTFGKCGDAASAEQLFQISPNKTVEMYNALMKGVFCCY